MHRFNILVTFITICVIRPTMTFQQPPRIKLQFILRLSCGRIFIALKCILIYFPRDSRQANLSDEAKGFIQRKWIKQTQRTIVKVHFSPRAWCALHFAGGSCIEPHILCMRINPQWNNIRYALHQLRFYDAFENILNFISLGDFLLVLIINECNFKFKPLSSRRRSKNCKFQFNLHPHYNLWINFRMKFSAREICRRDPIDSLLKCTQNSTYY